MEGWSPGDKTTAIWLATYVAPKTCNREPDGSVQCHPAVHAIKTGLDKFPEAKERLEKELLFIHWDESKWDAIGRTLTKDQAWKKFGSKKIKEMLIDIADGSTNGHSFIKFKGGYIDPFLISIGVGQAAIDKVDAYLEKVYRKHGIRPKSL